jgi:hypothetical protein
MRRVRRGQNTVEMALMLPLLALIIAIGIDFARVFQVATVVSNASRVGAEFAATHGRAGPSVLAVQDKAREELGSLRTDPSLSISARSATWDSNPAGGPAPCEELRVRVSLRFFPITPMAGALAPGGQLIEKETWLRRNGPITGC